MRDGEESFGLCGSKGWGKGWEIWGRECDEFRERRLGGDVEERVLGSAGSGPDIILLSECLREGDERGFLNVRVELEDGFEPEDTRVERDDSESKDSLLKKKTKENMSSKPN